ncbi:MAG: ABC transporter permease [Clostridiales Family XIII bacterium]|jgi:putative ABC transport system permease protein|nr:ABC transporter permease [Clostridiales Family XIII bacterium]
MYILENALQNIRRNRGRNLMIGIIIFVIIVSAVTALMIRNTADGVIADYKTRFGSEVSLSPNMQKLQEEAMANSTEDASGMNRVRIVRPEIPAEQYVAFGESEYLKEAVLTATAKTNSEQLKPIDEDLGGGGGMMVSGRGGPGAEPVQEALGTQYYTKLLGNEYSDFESGDRSISEGRLPEADGECMLSTELLENSGLSLGDEITLTSELTKGLPDEEGEAETLPISYTLTIVGTYLDATAEYGSGAGLMENAYTNRRNEILTTFDTAAAPMVSEWSGIEVGATYYLKSPDMLPDFADELYAKGLSDVFDVTTDEASYERIVGPVEGLKTISVAFVIIVLVFGGVIIALLSSIAIRERKYEIGVLRAMGMKRSKVALGLWTEMLVITAVCLVVGLGVGMVVAQPVTDVMLAQQVAAAEEAETAGMPGGGAGGFMTANIASSGMFGGQADAEALKDLDVSLGWVTLLELIGIAILLSSLTGLIATQKITKYEPIKILMERN